MGYQDNLVIPHFVPGTDLSGVAPAGGVVGGTVGCFTTTAISGGMGGFNNPEVAITGAGLAALFAFEHDALEGETVGLLSGFKVLPLKVGATGVVKNDPVKANATGQIIPQGGTGIIIGYALDTIAAAGIAPIWCRF